jgi:hypothetical protein
MNGEEEKCGLKLDNRLMIIVAIKQKEIRDYLE